MAPFFALKYAPPAMAKLTGKQAYPNAAPKEQRYGSIVVVGSVAGTYGGCWGPCYTMASHAALGVVRSGVAALKGSGVRINCISPGQIEVGVALEGVSAHDQVNCDHDQLTIVQLDQKGVLAQFPPANLQSKEVSHGLSFPYLTAQTTHRQTDIREDNRT